MTEKHKPTLNQLICWEDIMGNMAQVLTFYDTDISDAEIDVLTLVHKKLTGMINERNADKLFHREDL